MADNGDHWSSLLKRIAYQAWGPLMCSERSSRPQQGAFVNGRQGFFVADIRVRVVRITGLIRQRSEWILAFFIAPFTIPRTTFMRGARDRRKSGHAIFKNSTFFHPFPSPPARS